MAWLTVIFLSYHHRINSLPTPQKNCRNNGTKRTCAPATCKTAATSVDIAVERRELQIMECLRERENTAHFWSTSITLDHATSTRDSAAYLERGHWRPFASCFCLCTKRAFGYPVCRKFGTWYQYSSTSLLVLDRLCDMWGTNTWSWSGPFNRLKRSSCQPSLFAEDLQTYVRERVFVNLGRANLN